MSSRKNYKKIWEKYNKCKLPKNMEIHHKDGNSDNNNPENLLAVTLEEHLIIHYNQKDYAAVQAILIRMSRTEDNIRLLKDAASKHQLELLENGQHNFQKSEVVKKRIQAVKKNHKLRRKSGQGAFLGIKNVIENSKKAGKRAAELCAGFLDTKSPNHGSKHVKGTRWWIHKSGKRIRAKDCPGDKWKQGMKYYEEEI